MQGAIPIHKTSFLIFSFFASQILRPVKKIRDISPTIFFMAWGALAAFLWQSLPETVFEVYKVLVVSAGPLFCILEALQLTALALFGTDFIMKTFIDDDPQDNWKHMFLCLSLSLSAICFLCVWNVYNWKHELPLTAEYVCGGAIIGILLLHFASIQISNGIITQASTLSLLLAYFLYASTFSSGQLSNLLVQVCVALFTLLTIPTDPNTFEQKSEEHTKKDAKGGSFFDWNSMLWSCVVLLLTHVLQLYIEQEVSSRLFYYRISEMGVVVASYFLSLYSNQR